ncbi:RhuM family protein [Halarcobacter sp.]|uniref:RhuM family protein n=1 Tax=Halarcobacter sp. TaxID=2321133 RepID=UPI0029F4CC09|nr:RhuM family protein [Halarcobacter sp.]
MIIALDFKVRSNTGTKFRIWTNQKLKEYITKGFVLDDDRFKNGNQMSYFDELQIEEVQSLKELKEDIKKLK